MEITGNQRCGQEQQDIHRHTHQHIEPEHRIIIPVGGPLDIDERLRESRTLQVTGNSREDGQHTHNAIICRCEQTAEKNADNEIQHLHGAVVEHAPEKSAGGFLFQRLFCHNFAKVRKIV